MRGWVFRSRGPPAQVLQLENDLPRPTAGSLGPRDVLVKVKYAALFQGMAAIMTQIPHFNDRPWVAETAFSGSVVSTGDSVAHVKADDDVFGGLAMDVFMKYGGVLAEYVVLPDHVVVRKPGNLSVEGAGGMGSTGITAMQFMEVTNLKRGDRVLVTGASGGTGSLVVQAARATVGDGGLVVGTCSDANEQLVKDLGAHEVIDYQKQPVLHEYLAKQYHSQPFDAIIDIVGEDRLLYTNSPAYLAHTGTFLFAGNMPLVHGGGGILDVIRWVLGIKIAQSRPLILGGVPRKCLLHTGKIGMDGLEKLVTFIEEGKMRPVVDSVYEMDDVLKGYARLATSRARGKVLVHVQD